MRKMTIAEIAKTINDGAERGGVRTNTIVFDDVPIDKYLCTIEYKIDYYVKSEYGAFDTPDYMNVDVIDAEVLYLHVIGKNPNYKNVEDEVNFDDLLNDEPVDDDQDEFTELDETKGLADRAHEYFWDHLVDAASDELSSMHNR